MARNGVLKGCGLACAVYQPALPPSPRLSSCSSQAQAQGQVRTVYGYTQARVLTFAKHGEPSESLRLHTHSISPCIPRNAALLRALAVPVNPADVNMIQGTYGAKLPFTQSLGTSEPTAVPGSEGCFEVAALGEAVAATGLEMGDWVIPAVGPAEFGGTWKSHALIENAVQKVHVVKRAKGGGEGKLTAVQAATVSVNPCSAWRMLTDYVDLVSVSVKAFSTPGADKPAGGAWFLQNGANSGVGRAAIQLASVLWGLRSINVVRARDTLEDTQRLKNELCELGGTVVVTEEEFCSREFTARLREEYTRADREPLLLALNCVGGKSASQAIRCLSPNGTMVTYGGMSREPFPFPTGPAIFKQLKLAGFWLSAWSDKNPGLKLQTVERVLQLIREGKFRQGPFEQVRWDAETRVETLREAVQGTLVGRRSGKCVFVFGEGP